MRRITVGLVTAGLLLASAAPAAAQDYAPVEIVHQERVAVGPYEMTVGFSEWPVRAQQSLDFTFTPDAGIEQVDGTLVVFTPSGEEAYLRRPADVDGMPRHPRQPDVWGLDVFALNAPGEWRFALGLDGPQGAGNAVLTVPVLEQPGPPMALSWLVSTVPLLLILGLLGVAAARGRRVPT